ncbi:MAG TPA: helix-turn-helix transcriptional regulator [Pseudonocardiaceae bacterium]|nr:helix-turn-helix transcriptional regulator [Pseudonocardiaceae bacterium]
MTAAPGIAQRQQPFGEVLRHWREHRRLSQLDLAALAGVSARHLSFIETGRSTPSRDMVVRLSEWLEVPLRDRNHMLMAAGYAPVYPETTLNAPEMSAVRDALRQLLTGHEPFPAAVVDRNWNLVDSNSCFGLFTDGVAPELLAPPVNALRLSLHPLGLAPRIANIGQWRAYQLNKLARRVSLTGDRTLAALYDELCSYGCEQPQPDVVFPDDGDILVPLRVRHRNDEYALFCTVTTFGMPLDITLAELAIETFYPADNRTGELLARRRAIRS